MSRDDRSFFKKPRDVTHQAVQKSLLTLFPHALLEYRFPTLPRIADVALLPEKIIFEIQCSPISLQEVRQRNTDYKSIGFTVIWILHDRRFNRRNVSSAELYLRRELCYFTSITQQGEGFFYDQLEFFEGMSRLYKGPPYILDHFQLITINNLPFSLPQTLKKRLSRSPYYVEGDLTYHLLNSSNQRWARLLEKSYKPSPLKRLLTLAQDFFLYMLYLNADRPGSSSVHRHEAMKNREIPPNKG